MTSAGFSKSYINGNVQSKQRSLTAVSVMQVSNRCFVKIGSMIERNWATSRFVIGMIGANHIRPQRSSAGLGRADMDAGRRLRQYASERATSLGTPRIIP